MKTKIRWNWIDVELTTERVESSYGVPVLVILGRAYGPMDRVEGGDHAWRIVANWMLWNEKLTAQERELGRKFLGPCA